VDVNALHDEEVNRLAGRGEKKYRATTQMKNALLVEVSLIGITFLKIEFPGLTYESKA